MGDFLTISGLASQMSDCIVRRGLPRTQAAGGSRSQSQGLRHRDAISMTRLDSRLRHSMLLPNISPLKMQSLNRMNRNTAACVLDLVRLVLCELLV